MKRIIATGLVIVFLSTMGCAGMSDQQQRTMSGSLIGAAGGAGIAAIAGGMQELAQRLARLPAG